MESNLKQKDLPKNFCFRPWNEVYSRYDTFGPCCVNNTLYNGDFDSYLVSKELKELKKSFLLGKKHSSCEHCWNTEDSGLKSIRQQNLDISNKVHRLSLSLGYKCNFKCVMCNPEDSSAWSKDTKACHIRGMSPVTFKNFYHNIDWVINYSKNNKITLSIMGGEPFICDEYLYLLNEIDKYSLYDNINLVVTTNLSVLTYKDVNHLDILRKFPKKEMYVSFDGVGVVGEYIRTGFKMSKFIENLEKSLDLVSFLSVTIQIYNIFNMPHIFNFADKYNLKTDFNFLTDPDFLSINILSASDKQKVKDYYKKVGWTNTDIINVLSSTIDLKKKDKFLQYTKGLDLLWGRDCFNSIPELKQII